jgi:glycosyltransferase involved in cell wall biosynthesis
MKIGHIITRMIVGGAQENTLLTLRGHLAHGHETVLITGPTAGPEGKLLQSQPLPGLRVIEVPSMVRQLNPLADWRATRELTAIFRREAFEVVHTHSSKAGIIGRVAARRAGVPVVVHTVHGQAFHAYQAWYLNRLYIALERWAARDCDRIFAVAQAMVDQCVAARVAAPEKYQVVYSGMELDRYLHLQRDEALAAQLGLTPGMPVVGKIARIFELKGYEQLVAAAPRIVAAVPGVRFLIVGDGNLRPWFESEIAKLGLREHFVFAGLVAPSEIPRYISLMNALVHLSLREGLPRTVVQALAGGVPAVGYRLDGTPEAIQDGENGYLCTPGDSDGVATAISRLLSDPARSRAMGLAGRAWVRDRWDWHLMVQQLETAYAELLAKRSG